MPLRILEKTNYIYIAYNRKSFRDFLELKRTVEEILQKIGEYRNIVIDFTISPPLTEWEASLISNIGNRFKETRRFLKIVADESKKVQIESTIISKSDNISFHTDPLSLFRDAVQPE